MKVERRRLWARGSEVVLEAVLKVLVDKLGAWLVDRIGEGLAP
jgi:hypothetical protein